MAAPITILKMRQVAAPAGPQVDIFNTGAASVVNDPTDATATYALNSTGQGNRSGGPNWAWLLTGVNSDYQVRATLVSGTTPSGTLGTWQALSTSRSWSLSQTVVGSTVCSIDVDIRKVSDLTIVDSANIDITAQVNSTAQVDIFSLTAIDEEVDPADASATYQLSSTGTGSATANANWTWRLSGVSSDYEVRATLNSGTLTSGTTGTWQVLSTTRAWTKTRTLVGSGTANLTIEIRRASDLVIIDTAIIDITASVEQGGPFG